MISFEKPPLVEIVAEVHWPTGFVAVTSPQNPSPFPVSNDEEFFSKFGDLCAGAGFDRSERLVPMGFLTIPYQPVMRYRKRSSGSMLYQVGAGLFSANAVPPYSSWEDFRPVIRHGMSFLQTARQYSQARGPYSEIILRYINIFSEDLVENNSAAFFMKNIAGIQLNLPAVLTSQVADEKEIQPQLQLDLKLNIGARMRIVISEGMAAGKSGVILDFTVTFQNPSLSDTEMIMTSFERAHNAIQNTFLELTRPIQSRMLPIER